MNMHPFPRRLLQAAVAVVTGRKTKKKRLTAISLLLSFFVLGVTPAFATMIYTTFGNNFSANPDGYIVGLGEYDFTPGIVFTSNYTADISQIDLALNGPVAATVSLYDNSNNSPGALLDSWAVQPVLPTSSVPNPIVSITGISNLTLYAGYSYMLMVSTNSTANSDVWELNTQGINGYLYDPPLSSANKTMAAFDLQSNAALSPASVPAPAVTLLLGLSALSLLLFNRRSCLKA